MYLKSEEVGSINFGGEEGRREVNEGETKSLRPREGGRIKNAQVGGGAVSLFLLGRRRIEVVQSHGESSLGAGRPHPAVPLGPGRAAAAGEFKVRVRAEHVGAVDRAPGYHGVASVGSWGGGRGHGRVPSRVDAALGDGGEVGALRFCRTAGALGNILVGVSRLDRGWFWFLGRRRFRKAGIHVFVVLTSGGCRWLGRRASTGLHLGRAAGGVQRGGY